jgi:hypothetical protein
LTIVSDYDDTKDILEQIKIIKPNKSDLTELFIPDSFQAIKLFGCNEPLPDEVIFKKWHKKLTRK